MGIDPVTHKPYSQTTEKSVLSSFYISQRRVFPAILGVDFGAILNKALGDVDSALERGDVEWSAAVVIAGVDEGLILFEKLEDGDDVIVVGMPEYEGCAADSGFSFCLSLSVVKTHSSHEESEVLELISVADIYSDTLLSLKSELADVNGNLKDWILLSAENPPGKIHACSWSGVKCNTNNSAVTGLDLSMKSLAGEIFRNQFAVFTDLVSLNLSYNSFSSHLFAGIFNLINLTTLDISRNNFSCHNPIAVSIYSNDVDVVDGVIPAFVHGKKNTTLLKAKISSSGKDLDSTEVSTLKAEMKSKNGLPLRMRLDTRVRVKVFGLKTPKIRIRVKCDGIRVTSLLTAKAPTTASTSNAKCKVNLRVKIWKWIV